MIRDPGISFVSSQLAKPSKRSLNESFCDMLLGGSCKRSCKILYKVLSGRSCKNLFEVLVLPGQELLAVDVLNTFRGFPGEFCMQIGLKIVMIL